MPPRGVNLLDKSRQDVVGHRTHFLDGHQIEPPYRFGQHIHHFRLGEFCFAEHLDVETGDAHAAGGANGHRRRQAPFVTRGCRFGARCERNFIETVDLVFLQKPVAAINQSGQDNKRCRFTHEGSGVRFSVKPAMVSPVVAAQDYSARHRRKAANTIPGRPKPLQVNSLAAGFANQIAQFRAE